LKGVSHVQQEGKKLIQANNFAKEDIEARLQQLDQDWQNLKAKSVEKTHNLKETSEFVDFSREVRDIEEMLVSKLAVAEVTNVGENIDDCKLIQKKFDVFCLDVSSAEGIVDSLGQLADRLVAQQHSRSTEIEDLKSVRFGFFFF
jgi:spectrin alpha